VAKLDLLVLGDCNPDLVLRGGDVEPAFGQVERIVERAQLVIGGSGAITACGAARLGLRTALAGVVGADGFGRFMVDALTERGVDVSGLVVDGECPTGVSVVLVRDEDRAILTALGTIETLSADRVDRRLLLSARHVHVSAFFLQHDLRPDLAALLGEARAAGATTSVDPNWDAREEWDGGLLGVLAVTDVLLLNAEEAKRIAGKADAEAAARVLAQHCPTVVVKLGGEGALALRGDALARASALPVTVVDTVGAGDSFDAGFLAGTLAGRSLEQSLALAVTSGSLSTLAAGGTAAQPTLEEAAGA
jgi:sugar/nucleoside kinase (ribokinase family)